MKVRTPRDVALLVVPLLAVIVIGCSAGASPPAAPPDTVRVARVQVSPTFLLVDLGRGGRLDATAFTAAGAPLARSMAWTSRDRAIAGVDDAGGVQGIGTGFTYVTAAAGGTSDSALVAVAGATACPAPTIMSHGLDDGTFGPFTNDGYTLAQDPTARGGWSATHTWRRTGAETYAGIDATFPGVKRVYARWRYKQDPAFDNESAIKKLLFTKGPSFGLGTGLLVISRDRFMWYYDRLGDAQTNYFSNVGMEIRPSQLRGQWHWYELMNDISTSGALRVRFWIDGVLRMDHTLGFSNQGATIGTIMFNGTTNAPGTTGTDWLDELAISTECIGFPR